MQLWLHIEQHTSQLLRARLLNVGITGTWFDSTKLKLKIQLPTLLCVYGMVLTGEKQTYKTLRTQDFTLH